ncbi:MAG: AAA family ATPase [Acidobacteria bacterium]|nr:AAA family ATPase [Acidobacteriota bacterium]
MYREYFHFRCEPFGATPDPRFLYFSPDHAEALAALHYGLLERRGLLVLIGRPGLGKTALLYHLLERWKDRAETAFLFHPLETKEQMIGAVLEELGFEPTSGYVESCRVLRALAVEYRRKGKRLILIFDEAQQIPVALLEEIRLLSNLESPEEKLIEIILAGQPVLAERLAAPECEQIRQRVALWAEVRELPEAEVRRYVEHRLRLAGRRRGKLFTRRACSLLAQASQGIPRKINAICFEALSAAFADGKKTIGELDIRRAVAMLDETGAASTPAAREQWWLLRRLRWAAAGAVMALAGLATPRLHFQQPNSAVRQPAPIIWPAGSVAAAAADTASYSHAAPPVREPASTAARSTWVPPPAIEAEADRTAGLPPPVRSAKASAVERVLVKPSENLRRIALRKYGRWDREVWRRIRKSNPWLTDPNYLQAGEVLVLPAWKARSDPERR